jgi:cyclic-di-AMP phosphodiesterase PgpH
MIFKLINRVKFIIGECCDRDWKWFQKISFLLFFVLSLAFFLHFREVRIDHLELNSVAKKYVLAQVSFDFSDLETTRMLREESLRDIGLIYYFPEEDVMKGEQVIQDELIRNPEWRNRFTSLTFEDLIAASNAIRDTLSSVEFTDARTVQKLSQMRNDSFYFLPCAVDENGRCLMESVWDQVKKSAFPTEMTEASHFMFEKYRNYTWIFKEDFNLRHTLRRQIKDITPIKMTHVEAGSRIINAGDKVTHRHINMLKEMKQVLTEQEQLLQPLTIFGSIAFSAILIVLGIVYFYKFHLSILQSFSKMALIAVVVLMTLSLAKLTEYFILQQPGYWVDMCRLPLYLLFASIILSILVDRTVALVVSGFIAIVLGITIAMESHEFLIMNLSTAVMGIIWAKGVRKRKEIFTICTKVWLFTIPMVVALNLLDNRFWSREVVIDCVMTGLFILGIAILVITILPLLESAFGVVTDMTLMESADPNHPLLRRLSLEAGGTYQHSLSVSGLAEQAALAVGANAILCRIGALYHDIGKIIQPNYFTENLGSGFNMHQLLTPLESAQVIIQHVTEGIKLAEGAKLPQPVIDIIREHHGTTLVYFFYHTQIEKNRGVDLEVEKGFFRYPGPTPQSRESAIVMIADSIEAAFQCHTIVDEKIIADLIESIVVEKIREHQLDASGLTFDDLEAIKKAIFRSLLAIAQIIRPKYPKHIQPVPSEKSLR